MVLTTLLPSKPFFFIVLLLISYEFFDNFSFSVPVRLLEHAVCQRHYALPSSPSTLSLPRRDLDELQCKSPAVQSTLAYIRGYYSLFRTGPALFVGPYFGVLADRWGLRAVYSIVLVGLMLQLASFYVVCMLAYHAALTLVKYPCQYGS
ncbi:uncharacterized protein LY89DRAFT_781578 [Mollisia scopiformis]|uniref:Major facilitator superfamily (MFS) profile domain-containing protein n=1 Tax=Mollisia scopiformis TaxID=149040 RepID=A0A194XB14_MOLSC|nr:uncharacterized protein LY89DRAFT_781578 [Mollisia scopiformis]KUJ17365.1 hypothetical protein LY89DRAFT_781578 [Mollisia scopiformis]